jgi:uncharacterized protein YPO0396
MKQFKKVLILKWHYIEHECIQLGNINFLTGKNASGKSTLIDAMQLVLLGETNGNFFNKAANEKSLRTLSSYVRGELSDNEDGYEYLRVDDFSSIIAIEVYDTSKKKSFTMGIHMDVFNDSSLNHKYFIMEDKIPSHHFIRQELVMNISELKTWCSSEGIRLEQFPSNKRYREVLLARLGHVNQKFFSLFKKAVPFSPITDIKGFITEFICDTDKKIEIKDMQDNIRYYEKMKLEAEDIERRMTYLDKIHDVYSEYSQLRQSESIQKYVLAKGREQMADNYCRKLNEALTLDRMNLEKAALSIRIGTEHFEKINRELDVLNDELNRSDTVKLKKKYENDIKDLEKRVNEILKIKEQIFKKLRLRAGKWIHAGDEALKDVDAIIIMEQIFKTENVNAVHLSELKAMNERLNEKLNSWRQQMYEVEQKIATITEEKEVLSDEVSQLKMGKKSIPQGVRRLQNIMQDAFGDVPMLCDLIEINDPKWQNAIEGYLHLQKFHLIVKPDSFEAALKLYEKVKAKEKIYDVGLVDLLKVHEHHKPPQAGSLAEEIRAEDPYVRDYIDYLLGTVIKVDHVEDLRKHRTSITPTCMLYKNFVARNLNPNRYEVPFIGKSAVAKQLYLKEAALKQCIESYETHLNIKNQLKELISLEPLGEDMIEQLGDRLQDMHMLPVMFENVSELKTKLSKLDMTTLLDLLDKVEALNQQKDHEEKSLIDAKADQKRLVERCERIETDELPRAYSNQELLQEVIDRHFSSDFIIETGQAKYDEALARLKDPKEIVRNYDSSSKGTENKRIKKWQQVVDVRSEYTRLFMATYDIQAESNQQYDNLQKQLSETELPEYKAKIEDAIKKAQQEFRDDFISKLKYNIDVVREQINELNDALKNMSFGKDTYAFKMTPNTYYRKYYDMIMDPNLMSDFNIFSFSFQEKHGAVIEELFKKIVDVGEGAISADERAEIEANIAKYTDYRTYLDFDLVVTDLRGNKSHLSKMISKKSGGETQTPFYISVLASFFRIYRMNTKANDTARLIIFDEAFSKMDHERIEQCITLLKELGFQALISAPTEKIANITPLVDKTLCVLRTKETTVIKGFTKEELMHE